MKSLPENIIFIDLPEETAEVLVSVIFQYGYFNENDEELGRGHLLEHLVGYRLHKAFGYENVLGTIGDNKIEFDITLSKKNASQNLSLAMEAIFTPLEFDENIINREKNKIQSEIVEKSVNYYEWLRDQTISTVISSPAHIKRNRFGQIKNIGSIDLEDLKKTHERLLKQPVVICIGGYKLSGTLKKELSEIVSGYTKATALNREPAKIVRPKTKIRKSYYPTLPKHSSHISLVFPGPSYADSAIERYALTFLNYELYRRLDQTMEKLGIYTVDYEYYIKPDHGFISFSSFSTTASPREYKEAFFAGLKEVLEDKNLPKLLKDHLSKRKKNIKEDWANNYKRMGWIVDDMIDFGYIKDAKAMITELNTITSDIIKEVAQKYLNPEEVHTLLVLPKNNTKKLAN